MAVAVLTDYQGSWRWLPTDPRLVDLAGNPISFSCRQLIGKANLLKAEHLLKTQPYLEGGESCYKLAFAFEVVPVGEVDRIQCFLIRSISKMVLCFPDGSV